MPRVHRPHIKAETLALLQNKGDCLLMMLPTQNSSCWRLLSLLRITLGTGVGRVPLPLGIVLERGQVGALVAGEMRPALALVAGYPVGCHIFPAPADRAALPAHILWMRLRTE